MTPSHWSNGRTIPQDSHSHRTAAERAIRRHLWQPLLALGHFEVLQPELQVHAPLQLHEPLQLLPEIPTTCWSERNPLWSKLNNRETTNQMLIDSPSLIIVHHLLPIKRLPLINHTEYHFPSLTPFTITILECHHPSAPWTPSGGCGHPGRDHGR